MTRLRAQALAAFLIPAALASTVAAVEQAEVAMTHSLTRRATTGPGPAGSAEQTSTTSWAIERTDVEAVFEQMKERLVGEWEGRLVEVDSPVEATFYLVGNETALVEDIRRPDQPASRMHTVYHLADDELWLTHYCSYRNQPRLRAASVRDSGRTIEFELIEVTNLSRSGNRYTHRMIVSMPDNDHASITWVGLDEGYEGDLTAQLTRVR